MARAGATEARLWLTIPTRARLAGSASKGRVWLPQRADEGVDDLAVEAGPPAPIELAERHVDRESLPVRSVGRHGVEGVGHRDDSSRQRDLVAGQLARVAPAVPALVVVGDGVERRR